MSSSGQNGSIAHQVYFIGPRIVEEKETQSTSGGDEDTSSEWTVSCDTHQEGGG
jgi:hypothetical protein